MNVIKGLEDLLRWRELRLLSREKGHVINVCKYMMRTEYSSQCCPVKCKRHGAQSETQKIPFKQKAFSSKYGQTLAQVTQRDCDSYSLGDIQNSTGHSLRQPTALSGRLGQMILRGALQAQLPSSERDLGLCRLLFLSPGPHCLSLRLKYSRPEDCIL